MEKIIYQKLKENLNPEFLEVKNNSELHKGHLENKGTGNSHFAIKIKAESLKNQSKIEAHKKINKILKEEFANGMHALEIKILP